MADRTAQLPGTAETRYQLKVTQTCRASAVPSDMDRRAHAGAVPGLEHLLRSQEAGAYYDPLHPPPRPFFTGHDASSYGSGGASAGDGSFTPSVQSFMDDGRRRATDSAYQTHCANMWQHRRPWVQQQTENQDHGFFCTVST